MDGINVKGYGFLTFTKNMCKNSSSKYGQKLPDSGKINNGCNKNYFGKTNPKKTAEITSDLIGNKAVDKITIVSKISSTHSKNNEANNESETSKERYISPEKRQQIIDKLSLV